MRVFNLFLAILCLGASALPAAAQTPEERERLAWVMQRGRLLFALDRAAWVGTDDLLARMPNPGNAGVRGYIVERDGPALIVTFFGGPDDAQVAFYRGRVENHQVVDRQVYPATGRPSLTALQRRLAAIRGMAGRLGRRPCGDRPFNTAVIPPETPDGPIDLYLLTPQMRQGEYPFGGHYRSTIAADGSVQSSRAFTNTCLTMDIRRHVPPDGQPVSIAVTHLLDPIPTEIHVFTALSSGLDVYVGTRDRNWIVSCNGIRLLEEPAGSPKS